MTRNFPRAQEEAFAPNGRGERAVNQSACIRCWLVVFYIVADDGGSVTLMPKVGEFYIVAVDGGVDGCVVGSLIFGTRRILRELVLKSTRNFSGKIVENARTQQAFARWSWGKRAIDQSAR